MTSKRTQFSITDTQIHALSGQIQMLQQQTQSVKGGVANGGLKSGV